MIIFLIDKNIDYFLKTSLKNQNKNLPIVFLNTRHAISYVHWHSAFWDSKISVGSGAMSRLLFNCN